MIKYDLVKDDIATKNKFDIVPGCTFDHAGDKFEKIVAQFDTEEEALDALSEHSTEVSKHGALYNVEEHYIQKNEYDEDGDLVCTLDICEVSKMEIEVVDRETLETLKTFDNLKDAEEYYHDCIENNSEVHIRSNKRCL